jgi:hypothetical protein
MNAVAREVWKYDDKQDVLFPPYTPLLVIGKDKENKLVKLAVLRNKAAKQHLESGEGRNKDRLHWISS